MNDKGDSVPLFVRTCDVCAHGPRLCRVEEAAYVCEQCHMASEAAFSLAADAGHQTWMTASGTLDERWMAVARAIVEMYHAAVAAQDNERSGSDG